MADVMTVSNLVNRSIAILGMGATGLSVARYLSVIGAPFSFLIVGQSLQPSLKFKIAIRIQKLSLSRSAMKF